LNSWSSKKPSLVMARACVFIFQAFQLFSSSVQFCGLSRLSCPCRPESHKQNTCEPASVSCSPCRSILPCSQVRRVTNIYVLSFCVSSSLSVVIIRPISSMESELPVFLNSLTIIDSTNTGQLYVLLDDEKVAACVIANDEKVDGYLDAPWQIDSDE